jgi:uncharacterized protein (TIGR00255 family)
VPDGTDGLLMIVSMTGFARAETAIPTGALVCELRSVNHRFLEAAIRLPEELRALEPELRTKLQQELRRGKVDAIFTYRTVVQNNRSLEIDKPLVERLAAALGDITTVARNATQGSVQINPVDLLRYPGVIKETGTEPELFLNAGREVFARALQGLRSMRAAEGARLAELLQQRCTALVESIAQVRQRLPEVHAALRTRIAERVSELAITVNPERLEQEVALLAQRMDVAEELDRLDGHITETRKIIVSPEAAGRRLDFLMQEYNREANTLSSKSQDLTTTRIAVDMKVLIEQMREQVQNIE